VPSPNHKRFPYFVEYLLRDRPVVRELAGHARADKQTGLASGIGFAAALGAVIFLPLTVILKIVAFVAILAIGSMAGQYLRKQALAPKNQEQARAQQLVATHKVYLDAVDENRLHKDLDMTVAQLLEASAYSWFRVHERLAEPIWNGPQSSAHLQAIRSSLLITANEAMRTAVGLGLRCMAPPNSRRTPMEEISDSLSDLDLDGILSTVRKAMKGKKGFQSENLGEVYAPMREIAEKLKAMRDEVEQMTNESMGARHSAQSSTPTAELDEAIDMLRGLRHASRELDDGSSPDKLVH
jgi:hypothetical protein